MTRLRIKKLRLKPPKPKKTKKKLRLKLKKPDPKAHGECSVCGKEGVIFFSFEGEDYCKGECGRNWIHSFTDRAVKAGKKKRRAMRKAERQAARNRRLWDKRNGNTER